MNDENQLIQVVDLHKSFGSLQVLQGVTEHISKGEVVSIIGPSGGGEKHVSQMSEPSGGAHRRPYLL